MARLDSIKKSRNYHTSLFLPNLENGLFYEYEKILKCGEDFWKTKSRITGLTNGDVNTSIFYASTLTEDGGIRLVSCSIR